MTYQT